MSASSSQGKVRQRIEEGLAATMAKVANRRSHLERNVLIADIMRLPLDFIAEIIQANHWDYLYNCACPVYPNLVRDFYGLLEVVQDYGRGIILQTIVQGHIIQIDPQIIGSIIGVPVLPILANPFIEVLEPPSIEQLRDFLDAQPQGDERAHSHIKIGAFSPQHQLFEKIILHNLWPTARRSELILKRDQFLYALSMRMPFCLCKQILTIILDSRDDHTTGLPFACLVTKICLEFVTDIYTEPKMRVHDPFGSQTLMNLMPSSGMKVKEKLHSLHHFRLSYPHEPLLLRLLHLLHRMIIALLRL
jgi:hypothetical protein